MIVDTHVHICDNRYDVDRDSMIERAKNIGVNKFINIGAEPEENKCVVSYERKGVFKSIGMHPHFLDKCSREVFIENKNYFKNIKNIVAVGEIGLDYFKSPTDKITQKDFFERFLNIAEEEKLPVIIHDREAHNDVYEILKEYSLEKKGVIHCFSGNYEVAKKFIDIGYVLGIGGIITFKNAVDIVEVVRKIPLEYIVLETDAPYLAPEPFRGKRNEPSYLKYIIKRIADLKNLSEEEVMYKTTNNAKKVFNI